MARLRGRHGIALRLAQRFATLGEVAGAGPAALAAATGSRRAAAVLGSEAAIEAAAGRARAALEVAAAAGITAITALEPGYPARLQALAGAPAVLWVAGALDRGPRAVACVGTRAPTRFGQVATRRIVTLLAGAGWSVVSGLARGIDALAHRAALDAGGHTVAVVGNGLDSVFPPEHAGLARRILERGGALVSEQPPGTPATAASLVQRDRLQSGLSAAVVVLQSDLDGGAMHTVRFALAQGRPLFAPVPRGAHAREPASRALLDLTERGGAWPIRSRADFPALLEALEAAASFPSPEPRNHPSPRQPGRGRG